MVKIDSNVIQIANNILGKTMMKDGCLKQEKASFQKDYIGYINKPYIAELKFETMPKIQIDRQIAKLEMLNEGNAEEVRTKMSLDDSSLYRTKDSGGNKNILIKIESKPAFKNKEWEVYRKNKEKFKKELGACMYETTAGININYFVPYNSDYATYYTLVDDPVKVKGELPEEIPMHYIVTIISENYLEFEVGMYIITDTLFTCIDMNNTYISDDNVSTLIIDNRMLRILDISGMKTKPIRDAEYMFANNERLDTVIGLSNLKFIDNAIKDDMFLNTQIK